MTSWRAAALVGVAAVLLLSACKDKDRDHDADEAGGDHAKPATVASPSATSFAPIDWAQIAQALGKPGSIQPGNVYKVGMPRSDLKISVRGVIVKPALALGSWVAFQQTGDTQVMVMGDLVLTEDEVMPVLTQLQEGGIAATALHNHLQHETPRVMYLHIMGQGEPAKLAGAIHAAVILSQTPMGPAPAVVAPVAAAFGLDTAQVAQALGAGGQVNGGVYHVSIPRAEKITEGGVDVPPAMGTAIALNFQPTGGGKAAVTGDFVLLGGEVNPVIEALRQNGIQITALHSHMLEENPRLFFLHFWANDEAVKLAKGLRAALDKTNSKKATSVRPR